MNMALQFVHMEGGIFYLGSKNGVEGDGARENIDEKDPPPWVDVQENLFSRS